MKRHLHKLLSEALGNMFEKGQIAALPSFNLDVPKENFGDYTTNVALSIAKGGKFNADEVAGILTREIQELDKGQHISDIQVVNGFINFRVSEEKLAEKVLDWQEKIKLPDIGQGKKIVFEYSSPNTNKPLHIGHSRNDFFGMACINILKALGYDVFSTKIVNDRGIHIMKSMLMYQQYGEGKTPKDAKMKPDHFVGKFYSMFSQKSQENEVAGQQLEEQAQQLLQKWEGGDKEVRKLWKQMNNWFYEGVEQTYANEGSTFDEAEYESDIYDKGKDLVLDGVKKGIFVKEEDGSVSVDLTNQGLDKKYLLRKDGTTLYITQDMYLWDLRNKKHKPDLAIVTTSAEQSYHFNVLSKIFKLLGYSWAENFKHLPYEHVYLGKNKMSSREGNTIIADELLDSVKEKVRQTMLASKKIKASADDQDLVQAIALAAIKYGYLKYDRNTKIYFDLDETVAIEGNTGPYLQYTYARIQSILGKAGKFKKLAPNDLIEPAELSLMRMLLHYEESVQNCIEEYKPSILCAYLYELASKFNSFYDQVSVLNAKSEELKAQRLNLLAATANILEHGLNLLGIKAVSEM